MQTFLKHIVQGKSYCAIEHSGSNDQEALIGICARVKNGELEIISKEKLEGINALSEFANSKGKVHVCINNHHVLQKIVTETNESSQALVRIAFPNITLDDFYYEISSYANTTIIFLCRRSYIDRIIDDYKKEGITITSWSLGFLSIHELLPYLGEASPEIVTPTHTLTIEASKILNISETKTREHQVYDVGGEAIASEFLVAFGGVFRSYFNTDQSRTLNFHPEIQEQDKLFKQHRFFQKGLPIALGVLLSLFLINFLFYNYYYTEVDRLEQVSLINESQRTLLVQKDAIVSQKKKRFEDVVSSASSSISLYVDKLMIELPESVVLSDVVYQPIERKIRTNKEIQFEYDVLYIQGSTKQVNDISNWILTIEEMDFVENTFLEIKPGGTSRKTFKLKVKFVAQ